MSKEIEDGGAERHVVVPVKPTPDMLVAAGTVDGFDAEAVPEADAAHIRWWKLMLSAAPPVQMEIDNEPNRPKAGQHIPGNAGVSVASMPDLQAGGLSERGGELRPHGTGASPSGASGPRDPGTGQAAIAPPVQMEAVAWRVGVPNNEFATLHEDVAEIARKHGYEVTPLYASPVPSSERDDIIEMCAQRHDQNGSRCAAKAKEFLERGDLESNGQYADEAQFHWSSAAHFRSLKSQPAQESSEKEAEDEVPCPELEAMVARAVAAYNALSPEQKAAHDEAQRKSFLRSFMAEELTKTVPAQESGEGK